MPSVAQEHGLALTEPSVDNRDMLNTLRIMPSNNQGITPDWLPPGKRAAVCFSIDDLHPQKSTGYYEGGGDLEKGHMRHVLSLLDRHPALRVTLFTTADWRETYSVPTRKILAKIPWLRDHVYLAPRYKKGTMQLDRHPQFVRFLKETPRVEIALHGLYHCHKGLKIPVEFQEQTQAEFETILDEIKRIFELANLPFDPGLCPPGWNAPDNLLNAMLNKKIRFLASARDVLTPISRDARTNMSGLKNVSLLYPEKICDGKILHFPSNFQATSDWRRAFEIIECNGLLCVKAHITDGMLDSVCALYMNYLDLLFTEIERRYGDSIYWASMGEITRRLLPSDTRQTSQ